MSIKDVFGQEVKPGDWIAFPVRRGSHMWIQTARFLELKPSGVRARKPDGKISSGVDKHRIVKGPADYEAKGK